VWARARKTDVLVDPANVQLGTRPVFIDNPHSDWIWSDNQAQPSLVDRQTWEQVQAHPQSALRHRAWQDLPAVRAHMLRTLRPSSGRRLEQQPRHLPV